MPETPTKKLIRRAAPEPQPVKAVTKKVPSSNGVVRPPTADAPRPVAKKVAGPVTKTVAKKVAPRPAVEEDETEEMSTEQLRSGWSAAQETIDSTSTWAVTFVPAMQTQIIKILQAAPYASFRRHWIQRIGGKRPFTCLQSFNRDCPLCDVGDRASAVSSFNIALCGDDGEAVLKSWDCSVRVTQTLKTFANDAKIGPLNKDSLYFSVMKTEATNRQQSQTLISPVRERDLKEDYGVPPLDAAQIERLLAKAYANDVVSMNKRSELEAIADEIMNEDSAATGGQDKGWGAS